MSIYLLDTPVLLWWLSEPKRLSKQTQEIVSEGANRVLLSTAAVWEMSIKKTLGRLDFPNNLFEILQKERIDVLEISLLHALAVADLPLHHHDPFDRMQVAQARVEGFIVVTSDEKIHQYDVKTVQA